MKFTVERVGGECPTQAEGYLADGRPYYFGARHGDWSIFIGPSGAALSGDWVGQVTHLFAVGDDPTEGRMPEADVLTILDSAFGDLG